MATATKEMHKTKIDIEPELRAKLVDVLQPILAECIDLGLRTKQAHWNVKGPNFIALHKLFDEVYEVVQEAVDMVAERIMQLGGTALGTAQTVAAMTNLPAYPLAITSGHEHCEALSSSMAEVGAKVRRAIDVTEELGDAGTADLCTEVARNFDKYLWFVESHLHA